MFAAVVVERVMLILPFQAILAHEFSIFDDTQNGPRFHVIPFVRSRDSLSHWVVEVNSKDDDLLLAGAFSGFPMGHPGVAHLARAVLA